MQSQPLSGEALQRTREHLNSATPSEIKQLQQTLGNKQVSRLVSGQRTPGIKPHGKRNFVQLDRYKLQIIKTEGAEKTITRQALWDYMFGPLDLQMKEAKQNWESESDLNLQHDKFMEWFGNALNALYGIPEDHGPISTVKPAAGAVAIPYQNEILTAAKYIFRIVKQLNEAFDKDQPEEEEKDVSSAVKLIDEDNVEVYIDSHQNKHQHAKAMIAELGIWKSKKGSLFAKEKDLGWHQNNSAVTMKDYALELTLADGEKDIPKKEPMDDGIIYDATVEKKGKKLVAIYHCSPPKTE